MRKTFIESLVFEAKNNSNIWLLCADLGFSILEPFISNFPERFINVGIAEQNMIGIASGLALSGKKVFVYSIANFVTFRCLEQIRNDICYHNLDITIIGVGAGYSYGVHGYTHHAIEDVSIMNNLPNIKIISPSDTYQTKLSIEYTSKNKGPFYIRLGNQNQNFTEKKYIENSIDLPIKIFNGTSLCILFSGNVFDEIKYINDRLNDINIFPNVYSIPFISEIPNNFIDKIENENNLIITIEDSLKNGGFGSKILELFNNKKVVKNLGFDHNDINIVMTKEYAMNKFKNNAFDFILSFLSNKN
ncbi:MAG: transketolase C-terminal domain-containing protein [Cyanobacteriota bacterium]